MSLSGKSSGQMDEFLALRVSYFVNFKSQLLIVHPLLSMPASGCSGSVIIRIGD